MTSVDSTMGGTHLYFGCVSHMLSVRLPWSHHLFAGNKEGCLGVGHVETGEHLTGTWGTFRCCCNVVALPSLYIVCIVCRWYASGVPLAIISRAVVTWCHVVCCGCCLVRFSYLCPTIVCVLWSTMHWPHLWFRGWLTVRVRAWRVCTL